MSNYTLECKIEVEIETEPNWYGSRGNAQFTLYINGREYASETVENINLDDEGELEELARTFVSWSNIDADDIANNLE